MKTISILLATVLVVVMPSAAYADSGLILAGSVGSQASRLLTEVNENTNIHHLL